MPTLFRRALPALLALILTLGCHPVAAMIWQLGSTDRAPPHGPIIAVAEIDGGRALVVGSDYTRALFAQYGVWQVRAPLPLPRNDFAAAALASGEVLVAGGKQNGSTTALVERYDPVLDAWSAAPWLPAARSVPLMARLKNGTILVAGGRDAAGLASRSVYAFDATSSTWTEQAPLLWDVQSPSHRLFALADGRMAVVHDRGIGLFDPLTNTWVSAVNPPVDTLPPSHPPIATQLSDGRIVVPAFGVYDAPTDTWTATASPSMQYLAAAAVTAARAVFAGYEYGSCPEPATCITWFQYEYSAASNQWTQLPGAPRAYGAAYSLTDGAYFTVADPPGLGAGAVYRRSRIHTLRVANPMELPLLPAAGASYRVETTLYAESEALSRPMTGQVTVSDGSASCKFAPPATGCTLTTLVAGKKTLTISYPGDDNYAPASASYVVDPYLIVDHTEGVAVTSTPHGIVDIGPIHFTIAAFAGGTAITLTAGMSDPALTFTGWQGECSGTAPCAFTMPHDRHVRVKAYAAPTSGAPFNLDVDRDGVAAATTDALMILRYLLANPEAAVINGTMPTAGAPPGGTVTGYLEGIRPKLDIDGNGTADARTDGLLILRYLMGIRGQALVADCVGAGATRANVADIEAYLATLLP